MIEHRHGLRLALEAREALGVSRESGRQDLDGDVAVESAVARPVDLTHPARAESGDDLVGSDSGSGFEAHVEEIVDRRTREVQARAQGWDNRRDSDLGWMT